ncbi:M48 family metallopeptidase [Patescibacteria group bacterium]|nr:M48 family metallopeptidase [Patescibacteria group bacterium]
MNKLKVGNRFYPVLYAPARARTSSVRIRDGKVVLHLSRYMFGRKKDETILKFLKWAQKKLANMEQVEAITPVYKDEGRVSTHNKIYEIQVNYEDRKNAKAELLNGYVIKLTLPHGNKRIQFLSEKVIMENQLPYLKETLDELNQLYFKARYASFRFKRAKSRFGSCTKKGNINIAFRTLFMPREVFRYVCLHELAHLKEFNHSSRFWDLIRDAVPEYKEHEKWLRKHGFALG